MKLFFCDICNESIPLQDIKDNRATTIKGKIFCRACNPLNELGPADSTIIPPPGSAGAKAEAGAGSGASIALLFIGLVASLGASGYLLYERAFGKPQTGPITVPRVEAIESSLRDQKQTLNQIAGNVEGLSVVRGIPPRVDSLQEDIVRIRGEMTTVTAAVASAEKNLNTVGSLREKLDQFALQQTELGNSIARLEATQKEIQVQLKEVAERPPVIVTPADGGGHSGPGTPENTPLEAPPLDARLTELIDKLASTDAMVRWEAVDKIRTGKEKALVPYVVKLLADRDTFVKAQAIYTLGELKATKAVPDLIKLLRDDEQMIREESLTALVEITGQNFKFDLNSKTEREKGIKRWEEWLSKNKDSLGN